VCNYSKVKTVKTGEEIFGEHLRAMRQRSGLSQEKLAELAGLHRNYIGHLERGEKSASLHVLLKLSRAFEVEPIELLRPLSLRVVAKLDLDVREQP
jgi:transcriptional regulator with XRE-family HTH domain